MTCYAVEEQEYDAVSEERSASVSSIRLDIGLQRG